MSPTMKRILFSAAAMCGAVILASAPATPAAQRGALDLQKNPTPILCCDLRVAMNVTKGPAGLIQLQAKACNDGPGNYSFAAYPLDAYYQIITWHPPKTPAQEGDIKNYNHADLGTALQFHSCKDFTAFSYQIPDFSRYGKFVSSKTERQACKEFTAILERKNTGFSNCEDINRDNTHFSVVIEYMEKIK
jgi:hypothetical protein